MVYDEGIALITEVHRAVHALGLRITSETGLTQAEALVLALLHGAASMPLEDVHKAFLHRRSTLTNVLERLEERKYVERKTASHDRRRFDIALTREGKKKAAQVHKLMAKIFEMSGISTKDAALAHRILGKLIEAAELS